MARYAKLNDIENEILPMVVKIMEDHDGKEKAITNSMLREQLTDMGYQDVGQVRMRKIINFIRNNYILICLKGCNFGYYLTTDTEEIKAYITSLIDREAAIRHTRQTIERQLQMLL